MNQKKVRNCVIPNFGNWNECSRFSRVDRYNGYCRYFTPDNDFPNGACVYFCSKLEEIEIEVKYLEDDLFKI